MHIAKSLQSAAACVPIIQNQAFNLHFHFPGIRSASKVYCSSSAKSSSARGTESHAPETFCPMGRSAQPEKKSMCWSKVSNPQAVRAHMCTWVVKSGISVLKLFIELDMCKPCCWLFCYEALRPCWTCSRCGVEGVQDKWQMHRKAPHGVKIGAERSQLHSPQCVSFLPMRCQWQIRTVKRCRLRMAVRYKLYKATADRSRDLTRAKLHAWEATWHTMVTM